MTPKAVRMFALTSALVATLCVFARPAAAQEDDLESKAAPTRPAPSQDLPPPSTRYSIAFTGLGITVAWYGAALGASYIWHDGPWAPELRIPFAGPWMAMPDFKCNGEHPCGTPLVVARGILAGLDGIGQVGGIAIALESLFLPVQKSERALSRQAPKHAWVRPIPLLGRDSVGIGLVGQL
jgi:hypothetical protein